MQYLLMIYQREGEAPQDEDVAAPTREDYERFNQRFGATGVLRGGAELQPTSTATTVRVRSGEVLLTDGPFAETKDLIAGWMAVDVDSYERALEIAAELSAAPGANGEPIYEWLEVRAFMSEPPTMDE